MAKDIKNYLNTSFKRRKYIKLKLIDIPQEVIDKYNLKSTSTKDDSFYLKVLKGMYGIPQV